MKPKMKAAPPWQGTPLKSDPLPGKIFTTYSPPPSIDQAARKIAARFGLTASVAMVVATLAGFGGAHHG